MAFRELVANGTPPPLTGNDSDTLAEVKPQSNNTYAVADPQLDHIARLYIEAKAEAEALRSALVWEKVKVQQLESVLHSQTVTATEKFQMSETEKELARQKGWGWVLGLE